ncbi:MAG TPA: PHB depolymerase family esterase [Pirellulaceae bacterium]|nr:PHB depolymerase family esterase [Pirellulaceae bacterium]
MNRIFAEVAPAPSSVTCSDSAVAKTTSRSASQHALLAPLHYEPNYAYPLVVWLHGAGGDERQLARVMPHISIRNYVAVGVRGTSRVAGRCGYGWPQTDESILAAEQRVLDAVAAAAGKFHVHPGRVYLAGFEEGGTMAFRLALRQPQRFAGALSAGGAFPNGHMPLANLKSLREYPLFLAFCRDSLVYATEEVCQQLPLFHAAGLRVAIRQYPCGDELTTQMLHDMDVWMMEHVTGVASECDEAVVRQLGELN